MRKGSITISSLPTQLLILLISFLAFQCITPSIRQTQEQNMGDALFNKHRYAEAADHYMKMLDASRKLGIYRNTAMESDVWRKIANCNEMMGKYEMAMVSVKNAMAIDSADKNLINLVEDFRHEGMISVYMGMYYRGIRSLERSLYLSDGMENSLKNTRRLSIAGTYLALAQSYAVMGRIREALDYTDKALGIYRQAGDPRGEMECYLNMAMVYSDLGDIPAAKSYTERSLKIAAENKMGTARHNQLLASISSSVGDYENALRYQEKALEEPKRLGIAAQVIWATVGLGDIYSELGDRERAEKLYSQAKEARDTMEMTARSLDASLGLRMGDIAGANSYFSSEGSLTGKAISSLRMAEMMILRNENDSAAVMIRLSGRSFATAGNIQGLSGTRVLLGKLLVDMQNYDNAEPLLDSALKATLFPETVWQAYFQKGRMYEGMNRYDDAIESYKSSIAVIEKIRGNLTIDEFKSSFFESKKEVYDRLINLLMKKNATVDAFQYSEQARARAFYDILANKKIDFRGSLPGDLITLEQEKRLEMQKLYKLLQKSESSIQAPGESRRSDVENIKSTLERTQSEYEDLLREIKLRNPVYAEMVAVQPVNISDFQGSLDSKSAVLAYWLSDREILSWMVTGAGITGFRIETGRSELTSEIEKVRRAIQSNNIEASAKGLADLYKILISPFEEKLARYENIIIIPNGPLHFLPFQALLNSKGEYLVQKYNILYSPSAGVHLICNSKKVEKGSRFMGLALSDVSVENKAGLPGTEDELKKILPLFRENTSAFGMSGTETFVKKNASGYNFIHFATHGSYNYRQPLYSCLLFPPSEEDDGRLNVFEVLEMNLNAKLVTLSACETGLGNLSQGDELIGLSRAFIFAGSTSVIVSLWAVADYPTSLLMSTFYGYLKDHRMQEALTLAQRDVIKVFPQPQYWSPFILIGNGSVFAD